MLALYISLLDTEEQISKFEHIYTKYRGLMFYTAKGVLQDSYLAEDAVHETFLDIIRIIDSIRANNEKELSQFLRVLTHHKAVDMVRKCTRQKKSDTEIEDLLLIFFNSYDCMEAYYEKKDLFVSWYIICSFSLFMLHSNFH